MNQTYTKMLIFFHYVSTIAWRKSYFALWIFNNDSIFLDNPTFFKNESSIENLTSSKGEDFQMSLFGLSQTRQKPFPENCSDLNFSITISVYNCVKNLKLI